MLRGARGKKAGAESLEEGEGEAYFLGFNGAGESRFSVFCHTRTRVSTVRADEFTFSLAILPHRVNLSFLILQMELSGLPHGRPEFNEMQQSSTWHKASIDMTPGYPSFYMKS